MAQVEIITGETSKIILGIDPNFSKKNWVNLDLYQPHIINFFSKFRFNFVVVDSKTLMMDKLNDEDTRVIKLFFNAYTEYYLEIGTWLQMKIE